MNLANQPIFPTYDGVTFSTAHGMTYRQWLAGMALQGLAANPRFCDETPDALADVATALAGALIDALESSDAPTTT